MGSFPFAFPSVCVLWEHDCTRPIKLIYAIIIERAATTTNQPTTTLLMTAEKHSAATTTPSRSITMKSPSTTLRVQNAHLAQPKTIVVGRFTIIIMIVSCFSSVN